MSSPMRKTAVVGCGKVGYAYLEWLAAQGFSVIGLDPGPAVQQRIRQSFGDAAIANDYSDLVDCESIHICVPTEPAGDQSADLSIIEAVAEQLLPVAQSSAVLRVISQRSTCPPGTADRIGATFDSVSYGVNPSFLRKAAIVNDTAAPERIALGGSHEYITYMQALYYSQAAPHFVSASRPLVELLKYTENTMDAVLVSFWNELLVYASQIGLAGEDFAYLLDRFGDRPKFAAAVRVPGKAFGLWCLPKDISALQLAFSSAGCPSPILKATQETNGYIATRTGVGSASSIDLLKVDNGHLELSHHGRSQVVEAMNALRTNDGEPVQQPA